MGKTKHRLTNLRQGALTAVVFIAVVALLSMAKDTSEMAAMVQAIGSIFAIAVAIWLNRADAKERKAQTRTREAQRAAAFAARTVPFIAEVIVRLRYFDENKIEQEDQLVRALADPARFIAFVTVPEPDDLFSMDDINSVDVETIQACVGLIVAVRNWNTYVKREILSANTWGEEEVAAFRSDMLKNIAFIRRLSKFLDERLSQLQDARFQLG